MSSLFFAYKEAMYNSRADKENTWGQAEILTLVQGLYAGLLFLPGSQSVRPFIRALPFLVGLALAATHGTSRASRSLRSVRNLTFLALCLLVLNLLHPDTDLRAGLAQCVYQCAIASPLFFTPAIVLNRTKLQRVLKLIFITQSISATLGILQVIYPGAFLPEEFDRKLLTEQEGVVASLSYSGAQGETIIRPPGLSDLPGNAASSGIIVAMMGLCYGAELGVKLHKRAIYIVLATVGLAVVYLCHVRTYILTAALTFVVVASFGMRLRRSVNIPMLVSIVSAAFIMSFSIAYTLGGREVLNRFVTLTDEDLGTLYRNNRGVFLSSTLEELLPKYPLGAGVGRWGIMQIYFPSDGTGGPEPLWAEIQITGWLYDGGVLMWVLYGGAVLSSLVGTFRLSKSRDGAVRFAALMVFCVNFNLAISAFAGPLFNTPGGLLFWFLFASVSSVSAETTPVQFRDTISQIHPPKWLAMEST